MATYYIGKVRKDNNGNIVGVKTDYNEFSTVDVVNMIEKGHEFFVRVSSSSLISVGIYKEKFIRTHKDGYWTNNLDELTEF